MYTYYESHNYIIISIFKENDAAVQWQNSYDGLLKVECGNRQGFNRVRSQHSNGPEDRIWQWDCVDVAKSDFTSCYWTGYVNSFDYPMYYQCPSEYIMNGVESYHDNGKEDRRWKFKCCKSLNHFTRNCYLTDYINNWDAVMDYQADNPYIFNGFFSYHDNGKE